ncbi:DNA mismatch repair protein muts [Piptocephalis cylindrospora]|uniref:DNA mismatch repair protein muts n=1 Tax=Piptocephalis cylindrospora TaxID=1907219 RepID=A0A4P9Y381_9FUNG|nr:DNA mismatch repair protein muts [Piptocephalis cylindrospora]|eukprot:RKP13378.1 DNA mismatch repair protein muts [Piptocephalis cylindrospora]
MYRALRLWTSRGSRQSWIRLASTLPSGAPAKEGWSLDAPDALEPKPPLSRVLRQVKDYQTRHPKHLLLTRVGEFYELYYDQADEIGTLLNLTIVDRSFRLQSVRFGGFPVRQLSRHLRTLVRVHGRTVALNEQFQDPITKEFDRRVTRVITPGTLITEEEEGEAIEPREHDFLLVICPSSSKDATFGLAWVDLSTGDFFTKVSFDPSQTIADLTRLSPREIVLPLGESSVALDRSSLTLGTILERWMGKEVGKHLLRRQNAVLSQYDGEGGDKALFDQYLTSMSQHIAWEEPSDRANPADFTPLESRAGSFLLGYMKKVLISDQIPTLAYPQRDQTRDTMRLDHATIQGLELIRSLRENTKAGSVLHVLDRTITAAGSRLLVRQLCTPSTSLRVIEERLDWVEWMCRDTHLLADIRRILKGVKDAQRSVQQLSLSYGRGSFHILRISQTLRAVRQSRDRLIEAMTMASTNTMSNNAPNGLDNMMVALSGAEDLLAHLESRVHLDNMEMEEEDHWLRKDTYPELRKLEKEREDIRKLQEALQRRLQIMIKSTSVKLLTHPTLHHVVEVSSKGARALEQEGAPLAQALKGKWRYRIAEWTMLGEKNASLEERYQTTYQSIIKDIRQKVRFFLFLRGDDQRHANHIVAFLEYRSLIVVKKLPEYASQWLDWTFIAPMLPWLKNKIFIDQTSFQMVCSIQGGRHLLVERNLETKGRSFTPNDCSLTPSTPVWLLTG